MLYTLPLMAVHASSFLLCVLSTDGGMRSSVSTPLKSSPDDFRLAQSRGPNPGASATFLEGFFGFSVVPIGESNEDEANCVVVRGTPGCRLAKLGMGGGGINEVSLSIIGMFDPLASEGFDAGRAARWALLSAGNAGGTSSSPAVSDPSSSSSSMNDPGMEWVWVEATFEIERGVAVSSENQPRR